jgi:hypothetical protein
MFARSKAGVLAVSLGLIGLLCTLGLISQSSQATAAQRPAESYPLRVTPDQLALQGDVATVSNTLGQCTRAWLAGMPAGSILLGVNPASCNPADWRGDSGGEDVSIALKDDTDPDTGAETKILIQNLTTAWQTYTIPLSSFITADKTRLYAVTEFVFGPGTPPETVYFRRIQYNP